MRITLWSGAFPPSLGGIERFSEELAGWLADRHEVTVVTDTPREGQEKIDSRAYEVRRQIGRAELITTMRRADVVHIAGLSAVATGLARLAGKRPVVTHTAYQAICATGLAWSADGECSAGPRLGPCGSCWGGRLRSHGDVRLHRVAAIGACNVFVSGYQRRRIGLRGHVIYNPVARQLLERPFPSTLRNGGTVLAAGRLVREKGFDILIGAVQRVPAARLVIAGSGPERSHLESLSRELRVQDRVRLVGRLPLEDLADLYGEADIACIPSQWAEPFGYAAAEGLALGTPVVATPVGAFTELLADGRGSIADGRHVASLADALRQALSHPDILAEQAKRGRRFAESELHISNVGRRYEELYETCAR